MTQHPQWRTGPIKFRVVVACAIHLLSWAIVRCSNCLPQPPVIVSWETETEITLSHSQILVYVATWCSSCQLKCLWVDGTGRNQVETTRLLKCTHRNDWWTGVMRCHVVCATVAAKMNLGNNTIDGIIFISVRMNTHRPGVVSVALDWWTVVHLRHHQASLLSHFSLPISLVSSFACCSWWSCCCRHSPEYENNRPVVRVAHDSGNLCSPLLYLSCCCSYSYCYSSSCCCATRNWQDCVMRWLYKPKQHRSTGHRHFFNLQLMFADHWQKSSSGMTGLSRSSSLGWQRVPHTHPTLHQNLSFTPGWHELWFVMFNLLTLCHVLILFPHQSPANVIPCLRHPMQMGKLAYFFVREFYDANRHLTHEVSSSLFSIPWLCAG